MRKMKKLACGIMIAIVLLMPLCEGDDEDDATKEGIVVERNNIFIHDDRVEEEIIYKSILSNYNGTLQLWAPWEVEIEHEGNVLAGEREGDLISLYLGDYNISIKLGGNISLKVNYSFPETFEKKFIYKTEEVKIQIHTEKYPRGGVPLAYAGNNTYLYSSDHSFEPEESFMLEFIEKTQAETDVFSLALGIVAILLAVILVSYIALGVKRRGKIMAKESDESLALRKRLLMDVLKTLELEHEKGKISDVYYVSIKDYFKGEAIKVLKEIERRK